MRLCGQHGGFFWRILGILFDGLFRRFLTYLKPLWRPSLATWRVADTLVGATRAVPGATWADRGRSQAVPRGPPKPSQAVPRDLPGAPRSVPRAAPKRRFFRKRARPDDPQESLLGSLWEGCVSRPFVFCCIQYTNLTPAPPFHSIPRIPEIPLEAL